MQHPSTWTILIVAGSADDRRQYQQFLHSSAQTQIHPSTYHIQEAESATAGVEACQRGMPDLILWDSAEWAAGGAVLADDWASQANSPAVVVVIAPGQDALAAGAIAQGAQDYLLKSTLTAELLCRTVQGAIAQHQLKRQLAQQSQQFEQALVQSREREAALRQSETKLSGILNHTAACISSFRVYADRTLKVEYRSAGIEQLTGYSNQEFIENDDFWRSLIFPDDLATVVLPAFDQIFLEQIITIEYRLLHKDGCLRWISSTLTSRRNEAEDCWIITSIATDISNRKHREAQHEQAEAILRQYERVVSTTPDGMAFINRHYIYQIVNQTYLDRHSNLWNEIVGQAVPDVMGAEFFEIVIKPQIDRCLAGETVHDEGWFTYQNAGSRFISVTHTPCIEPDGTISGVVVNTRDLTDLQRTKDALRQNNDRLQRALEAGQIVAWEWDLVADEVIGYGAIHGRQWHPAQWQVSGSEAFASIHPDDLMRAQQAFQAAIQQAESLNIEYRLSPSVAMPIQWQTTKGKVVVDSAGHPIRLVGTAIDISDRKQTEAEQQHQTERWQLFAEVTLKIRQSLELSEILRTTVTEVLRLLQNERVVLFQILPDGSGTIVEEAVTCDDFALLGQTILDPCFRNSFSEQYRQGRVTSIADIDTAAIQPCHADLLRRCNVRANLVVPVIQADRLWGLLIAHQCTQPRPWEETETDLLIQLANQVGIAIQQSYLYQQLQRELMERQRFEAALQQLNQELEQRVEQRTQELVESQAILYQREQQSRQQAEQERLLRTITQQLRQSLDLDEILSAAVTKVRQTFQADRAVIFQLTLDGAGAVIKESVLPDYPRMEDVRFQEECFPPECYEFYQQGQPRIVADVTADDWSSCLVELMQDAEVKSKVVAPITQPTVGGTPRIWGLLIIHACAEHRLWQEIEAALLQQIADQLAIALDQAGLYQRSQLEIAERKQIEIALHQQARRERLIMAITQRIRESLELERILQRTVDEIQQVLQADRVFVYRVFPNGTGAAISEAVVPEYPAILNFIYPEECFPTACAQGFLNGHIYILNDLDQESVMPCMAKLLRDISVRAKLVVPIISETSSAVPVLWGLLIVHQCSSARQWRSWEIELLQQITTQLAIAIQQANLYQQVQSELRDRTRAEDQLRASLGEKEVLLQEVHHRVKNNMQLISSLLNLQASSIQDTQILEPFQESQRRIEAMAMIHEHLYRSPNLARINFVAYVQDLTAGLLDSYSANISAFCLRNDVSDIELDITLAIPCGLIINELVSNAIKYAFPTSTATPSPEDVGEIIVRFFTSPDDQYVLIVQDNGCGISQTIDIHTTTTLGLQVVSSLSKQLDGTLTLDLQQGTMFTITFPIPSEGRY